MTTPTEAERVAMAAQWLPTPGTQKGIDDGESR